MSDRLRIAVTGLAATFPFGGVFWDYMQYALGFLRLGHDVLYLEDTGRWCYDPAAATFVPDGGRNAAVLGREIARLDPELAGRWFYRDGAGKTYGRPWSDVAAFCRDADLFLHISASTWMRDEYLAARRLAFIDSDPMYTQASITGYVAGTIDNAERARVEMMRNHHVFFTFGENVGKPGCRIPTYLFDWIPTRQPVVVDCFDRHVVPPAARRRVLTTVASWEPAEKGPTVDGVTYRGKSAEFERFIDLPRHSPLPLEASMGGPAPTERLRAHGWLVRNGYEVSSDPWTYRDYLAHSLAEFGLAKNAYVASRSGWFSCRTACYLALGVPAVVQDTGFSGVIPTGEGILAFTEFDEALDAIARIEREPERHGAAARDIAREYFGSDRILARLIDAAMNDRPAVHHQEIPC